MQLDFFINPEIKISTQEVTHVCRKCKENKTADDFYYHKDGVNKVSPDCKTCYEKTVTTRTRLHKTAPPRPDCCDVCKRKMDPKKLYLDHCHITNEFRGWLCTQCNNGIGQLGDDIPSLERALAYLRSHYDG